MEMFLHLSINLKLCTERDSLHTLRVNCVHCYQLSLWNTFLKSTSDFTPSQLTCISRDLMGISGSSGLVCPMLISFVLILSHLIPIASRSLPCFLRQEISKLWPLGQPDLLIFVNEVLLELRGTHLLCVTAFALRWQSCNRDLWPTKPKVFTICPSSPSSHPHSFSLFFPLLLPSSFPSSSFSPSFSFPLLLLLFILPNFFVPLPYAFRFPYSFAKGNTQHPTLAVLNNQVIESCYRKQAFYLGLIIGDLMGSLGYLAVILCIS